MMSQVRMVEVVVVVVMASDQLSLSVVAQLRTNTGAGQRTCLHS